MSASIPLSDRDRARRLGMEHAIGMLHELSGRAASCINDDAREEPEQDISVVLRYLESLEPAHREGFAAILTDYLGSALDGGVPDIELYEEMLASGQI